MQKIGLVLVLVAAIVMAGIFFSQPSFALTKMAAVGDIGCKTDSISNLRNIADSGLPLLGLGDYMYNCHPGDIEEGKRLGDYYHDIWDKVGAEGNHEHENGQESQWAMDTFRYPNGYAAWSLGNVGIIVMNPYLDFEEGSDQYDFIVAKSEKLDANPNIDWIVYVTHEPMWTPSVDGGHGPNTDLRDAIGPIVKGYNGFLIQAHNHVTAFGTNDGVNQILCGGGGYGGDDIEKLSGFDYATADDFGYCSLEFNTNNTAHVNLIGTDGQIVKSQIFTK
jgi:hypothetical protein